MRLAILTDIHANREALTAVLADQAARGCEGIVILGDIVGYGPDPEWCCDRVMELAAAGAIVLKGNHDAAISMGSAGMTASARRAIDWTRPRMTSAQAAFLAGLPMLAERDGLLFVHASAEAPQDWDQVADLVRDSYRMAAPKRLAMLL